MPQNEMMRRIKERSARKLFEYFLTKIKKDTRDNTCAQKNTFV